MQICIIRDSGQRNPSISRCPGHCPTLSMVNGFLQNLQWISVSNTWFLEEFLFEKCWIIVYDLCLIYTIWLYNMIWDLTRYHGISQDILRSHKIYWSDLVWHLTFDFLLIIYYIWHLTFDIFHLTFDIWHDIIPINTHKWYWHNPNKFSLMDSGNDYLITFGLWGYLWQFLVYVVLEMLAHLKFPFWNILLNWTQVS